MTTDAATAPPSTVTIHAARQAVAAHRRGAHADREPRTDCRLCRRQLATFVRYGVGLTESELRLLDGNR